MEHQPVLLHEVVEALLPGPGWRGIDGTLGDGGHAEALLAASRPDGRLLGLDADPEALKRAAQRLAPFGTRVVLALANFRQLQQVAEQHGFTGVNGIILDLGISSYQLSTAERGFSFALDGPLDMRIDPTTPLTAAEIVNEWPLEALAEVIYRYGEEPRSRRIARAIVAARPLHSTGALAEVVARAVGGRRGDRIHPATQTFLGLRSRVNNELEALEAVLPQAVALLAPGGRLAVITFNSLEDRIVKHFMQREARACICEFDRQEASPVCRCGHRPTLRVLTRKPIQPAITESHANPRSRSAKLRVAQKLETGMS